MLPAVPAAISAHSSGIREELRKSRKECFICRRQMIIQEYILAYKQRIMFNHSMVLVCVIGNSSNFLLHKKRSAGSHCGGVEKCRKGDPPQAENLACEILCSEPNEEKRLENV